MARQVLAGGVRAVARVITWIENQEPVGAAVLKRLTPPEKRAMVIGITGYPGTGKSTLIDQLIAAYRRLGKTVGVRLKASLSVPLPGQRRGDDHPVARFARLSKNEGRQQGRLGLVPDLRRLYRHIGGTTQKVQLRPLFAAAPIKGQAQHLIVTQTLKRGP